MAILGGSKDPLADPTDVAWFHSQVKDSTIYFKNDYDMDHMTFAIARNMDFFTKDVLSILNHHNGKCSESTAGSNYVAGNKECEEKKEKR